MAFPSLRNYYVDGVVIRLMGREKKPNTLFLSCDFGIVDVTSHPHPGSGTAQALGVGIMVWPQIQS